MQIGITEVKLHLKERINCLVTEVEAHWVWDVMGLRGIMGCILYEHMIND